MWELEIKMHFKNFYVKIIKSGFWKSSCHGNGLISTDLINGVDGASARSEPTLCFRQIVFWDDFYEPVEEYSGKNLSSDG